MQNILPIWQPIGYSTHIISKKVAEKYGVLTSHTGTLDPMAEGVIIVLLGEERHKKYEYAAWRKTYEFEILFGVSTDSYDGLGLVTQASLENINLDKLDEVIHGFHGQYAQQIPTYAAIKIKGKPVHWYARQSEKVELPQRRGEIYSIELLSRYETDLHDAINGVVQKIQKIQGNLRQDEVIERWQKLLDVTAKTKVNIAKLQVEISKGLYIRSLSQDIAKKLNIPAFVYSLTRTKNGVYDKNSSKSLIDVLD